MPKAKNVEEYLRFRAKGYKSIEVDFGNQELRQFVLNLVKNGIKKKLHGLRINIEEEKYFYKNESILFFGKYKDTALNLVFKCDPGYIEWCLINGDSFCISEESIDSLENSGVFVQDDLVQFIEHVNESLSRINLSTFKLNNSGLPYSDKVKEEKFEFSKEAKERNREKLNSKLNPHFVLLGGSWNRSSSESRNYHKRKIIILLK